MQLKYIKMTKSDIKVFYNAADDCYIYYYICERYPSSLSSHDDQMIKKSIRTVSQST